MPDISDKQSSSPLVETPSDAQEPSAGKDKETPVAKKPDGKGSNGDTASDAAFPIIGVGASAGGLRAFKTFVLALPEDPGMAFVLVQHLAPDHESELAELLQNHTRMKVSQVQDTTDVSPNCIYVIPPGKNLWIEDRTLHLSEARRAPGHKSPIDRFFRSLAEDCGDQATAIVLTGTGSDGSLGIKAVKEKNGLCMAQEPGEAEYDGMPRNAIATGQVDVVAPVQELAATLVDYHENEGASCLPDEVDALPEDDSDALREIFSILYEKSGHDFSVYKRATILRRLSRRMQVNHIETLEGYRRFLKENAAETDALFKDFLISVTNFFRDADAFEALAETAVPQLFEDKDETDSVRVWVPGCATGEEAYSIAILLHEYADTLEQGPEMQVFATDLDSDALATARNGLYPSAIVTDLTTERINRFFERREEGFQVSQFLMDTVLFADHNLLKDPPFSQLDLISCRNLLIYIQREAQEQIFERFHYALNEEGHLFLGNSESPDAATNLFRPVQEADHLYVRRNAPSRATQFTGKRPFQLDVETLSTEADTTSQTSPTVDAIHREVLVADMVPASVLVDESYDIVHMLGDVGTFIRIGEGEPTFNLLQMLDRRFRLELRPALFRAFDKREPTANRIGWSQDEDRGTRITVRPVEHSELPGPHALVLFEEVAATEPSAIDREQAESDQEIIEHLENELAQTQERLRTVMEEYETTNEELKASNEELQSMNEELRSTTEELETSKEELQSTNEELITVNQELKEKVEEVNQANADLKNLLASTDIATLFLDRDLKLQRYTPRATDVFNVIPGDIGRPLEHLSHEFENEAVDIPEEARTVLQSLDPVEHEMQTGDLYCLMRIMPYRTENDGVEGVVMTFIDITERRKAELSVRRQRDQQEAVSELGLEATRTMDLETLKQRAAERVAQTLDVPYVSIARHRPSEDELVMEVAVGMDGAEAGQAPLPATRDFPSGYALHVREPVMTTRMNTDQRFQAPPHVPETGEQSCLSVPILNDDTPHGVLNVYAETNDGFTDNDVHFLQSVANLIAGAVTRHNAEEALRRAKEEAEAAAEAKSAFVANVSHDLRTPLMALLGAGEVLRDEVEGTGEEAVDLIQSSGEQLRQMLDSVLNFIESGETSVQLHLRPANITEEVDEMLPAFRMKAEDEALDFEASIASDLWARIDVTALRRVLSNLVDNAVKYTDEGRVSLRLARDAGDVVVEIEDTGQGMSKAFQRRAFNAFEQETMGETRTHDGSGLGLAIVQEMAEGMDGSVQLDSTPGEGTCVTLRFPWLSPEEREGSDDVESTSIVTRVSPNDHGDATDAPADALQAAAPFDETPLVFIVEDNPDTRRVMEMMLESGCQLTMSPSYDKALSAARSLAQDGRSPDVLLLDIHLGEDRTGIDLLQTLREDIDTFANIPAVACTAFAQSSDRERYLREGFDAYLSKPFGTEEVVAVIREAVADADAEASS